MNVFVVTPDVTRSAGGMRYSVPALWRAAADHGVNVRMYTARKPHFAEDTAHWDGPPLWSGTIGGPSAFHWIRGLQERVSEDIRACSGPVIMSLHGLWLGTGLAASRMRRALDVPLIVHPHGMLEPWAMAAPRLRKRAAAKLFEESNLHEAACLRALNPIEARNFRARGLDAPIACIGNGVSMEGPADRSRTELDAMFPQLRGARVALFLGRVHPKKGLPMMLRALRQIGRAAQGWRLLIAGPDEVGHAREILSLAQSLGVDSQIVLSGTLGGDAKRAVLAGADAFVLPSHSEGFSMAVLEGAAAGLPVLLTRPCNFRELAEQGGAIEVAAEEAAIREGFEHLIRMTDDERREMGELGRAFVEQTYSWPQLGAMMAETCCWIIDGGESPDFVDPGLRTR